MKKIFTLVLILIVLSAKASIDNYTYIINLTKVVNDRVQVELRVPQITSDTVIFYMPKIIPGTYQVSDYGRFVSDFKALDNKGKELAVLRTDDNTFVIPDASKIDLISYWIDDTYDADMGEIVIDPMGGTNIEKDKNFVINTGGFFGYLDGKEDLPIELQVVRSADFYGSTGLIVDKSGINPKSDKQFKKYPANSRIDIFKLDDYHHLIDSPLMYNRPDTTSVFIENTQILISVYSLGNNVQSQFVAETMRKLLLAQKEYLGGKLPVDKYAFLFYFEDLMKIADVQGALEHSYSSYYYLPDVDQNSMEQTLRDIAAHEFFHIVTPLGIHSEEIEFFDFNHPKMSRHLWLYEGVTEYFAGHVQLKYEMVSLEDYLEMIRLKLIYSTGEFDDNLPFTDLSQYTLDKYPDQYQNVYQKGALIGLCLDIKLLELSEGKYGLQNLLADLTEKFGKNKPFKDEELFTIIEELTYPQVGEFLKSYVSGTLSLPYTEIFNLVGINHHPYQQTKTFTLGNFGITLEGTSLVVEDISNLNEFGKNLGYQKGDVLYKFQGTHVPENPYQISTYIDNILSSMIEGEEFSVTVLRKDEKGKQAEVELKAEAMKFDAYAVHVLEINQNPSEKQLKLRQNWILP
ncbi:MAG TPA: peptidase M61 [Cyclobacteriaceae bacterium]|jgi:predicted metalloprotease with PDZ domain